MKSAYLKQSAQFLGLTLLDDEVDVFSPNTDLVVVAPRVVDVNSIEVKLDQSTGGVRFGVHTSAANGPMLGAARGGFDSLVLRASGSVTMTLTNWATAVFTWSVAQETGETVAAKDYYVYKRKAIGQPIDVAGRPSALINYLYMKQTPHAGYANNHLDWFDIAPDGSDSGVCNRTTTIGVNVYVVYIETNFQTCGYDVGFTATVPGEMWVQSNNFTAPGIQSVAYMDAIAVRAGTTPYFDFYQEVGTDWMHGTERRWCWAWANKGYYTCQ